MLRILSPISVAGGQGAFYDRSMSFCQNVRMPNEFPLTLRQADRARTDFVAIEGDLEFIMGQLARMPTRAFLCRMLLLASASIWTLLAVVLLIR
jgi:hypothetical protein